MTPLAYPALAHGSLTCVHKMKNATKATPQMRCARPSWIKERVRGCSTTLAHKIQPCMLRSMRQQTGCSTKCSKSRRGQSCKITHPSMHYSKHYSKRCGMWH